MNEDADTDGVNECEDTDVVDRLDVSLLEWAKPGIVVDATGAILLLLGKSILFDDAYGGLATDNDVGVSD